MVPEQRLVLVPSEIRSMRFANAMAREQQIVIFHFVNCTATVSECHCSSAVTIDCWGGGRKNQPKRTNISKLYRTWRETRRRRRSPFRSVCGCKASLPCLSTWLSNAMVGQYWCDSHTDIDGYIYAVSGSEIGLIFGGLFYDISLGFTLLSSASLVEPCLNIVSPQCSSSAAGWRGTCKQGDARGYVMWP